MAKLKATANKAGKPKKKPAKFIEITYGTRKVKFAVSSLDGDRIVTGLILGRFPIDFDCTGKPVYFDWDRHGRYAVAEGGVIKYRRGYRETSLPYAFVSSGA